MGGPPEVVAVVGATATGKSDLAVGLAEALGGDVVNADAMQLYRGMDIGTAKLPLAERRGVPHHQIDVLDADQEASVAAYQRAARADLAAIRGRRRPAVLAGGSGLYVTAVLGRLDFPGTDPLLRAELTARAEVEGSAALHAELAREDPASAAALDPGNVRRVVRALEVVRLTGEPFRPRLPVGEAAVPAVRVGLRLDRPTLDERIASRARRMFAAGLLEETRALLEEYGSLSRTASRAVGYAQALDALAGRSSVDEALEATIVATRRLARRQEKWFRRESTLWFDAEGDPARILDAVLRRLAS